MDLSVRSKKSLPNTLVHLPYIFFRTNVSNNSFLCLIMLRFWDVARNQNLDFPCKPKNKHLVLDNIYIYI